MIYDLYFYNYNNYYNRIVKKETSLAAYGTYLHYVSRANFNPNDGVAAEQILNYEGDAPDYMIAVEAGTETIISRWFVIEMERTRSQQYKVMLYRDVVADWYDEIVTAPCFIEKGYVTRNDSAIFNLENMEVNQIKTSQTELKDKSGCQWIVGYIPKNIDSVNASLDYQLPFITETVDSLKNWPYYSQLNTWYQNSVSDIDLNLTYRLPPAYYNEQGIGFNLLLTPDALSTSNRSVKFFEEIISSGNGYQVGNDLTYPTIVGFGTNGYIDPQIIVNQLCEKAKAANITLTFNTIASDVIDAVPVVDSYVNSYIKTPGAIYRITKQVRKNALITGFNGNVRAINVINGLVNTQIETKDASGKLNFFSTNDESPFARIDIEEVCYVAEEMTLDFAMTIDNTRGRCLDSPYDMFCIPYADNKIIYTNEGEFTMTKQFALILASEIASSLGSSNIYDLQLLPYCPVPNLINAAGNVDARSHPVTYVEDVGGNNISCIIWCLQSSQKLSIDVDYTYPENALDFKIANQCDLFRLVGPNDGSIFQFSPTKNRGLKRINITFTYKPFQPYIHVYPEFNGLYGDTFEWEKRGLILRGDFSIAKVSEAWADYKSQNSNYQDIFNRQIENMEINNSVQSTQDIASGIAGTLTGVVSGAAIGSIIPGFGTAIGAASGAIVSGVGAWADIHFNEQLRNEALDYTKDQFAYNLQTIKARPDTLTKVSAFDIDCSPFPMLEQYSCTEIEKTALRNKIIYNGMTIMRIGQIQNFIEPNTLTYVKGKLIRLDNIPEEYHFVNVIASEINKGVFI